MPDFTVEPHGVDSSGRAILATNYMWDWWHDVCNQLGFTPTIVQGAFMSRVGGGASASAGYHDGGGCFDLRTWDLPNGPDKVIRTLRTFGAGAWLRDQAHGGFDPHIHFVLGTDKPLASGAAQQWRDYIDGGDGLYPSRPDYHWRPSPLVTTPPEVDEMANYAEQLDRIEKQGKDTAAALAKLRKGSLERDRRLIKKVTGVDADLKRIEAAVGELGDEE